MILILQYHRTYVVATTGEYGYKGDKSAHKVDLSADANKS